MSNLLKAITNYLNEDLEEMKKLEIELKDEIQTIQSNKEKKQKETYSSLENILLKKTNDIKQEIEDIKQQTKQVQDSFLFLYKDRIKHVIEIYKTLKKVDIENERLPIEKKATLLERERARQLGYPMYIDDWLPLWNGKSVSNCILFDFKKNTYIKGHKIIIDAIVYITENNINFFKQQQYTFDNDFTFAQKDLMTFQAIEEQFIKFEEKVNNYVKKLIEENE